MSPIELDEIRVRDLLDYAGDPPAGVYADRRRLILMVDDQARQIAAMDTALENVRLALATAIESISLFMEYLRKKRGRS